MNSSVSALQAIYQVLLTHAYRSNPLLFSVIFHCSVFDISPRPSGPSAADVIGVVVTNCHGSYSPAVLSSSPLKCQASSVLRCCTVYLLPLLSTLLIDAIFAVITPLVIKQHFSLPVLGCQALLPSSGVFSLFSPSTTDSDSNSPR